MKDKNYVDTAFTAIFIKHFRLSFDQAIKHFSVYITLFTSETLSEVITV